MPRQYLVVSENVSVSAVQDLLGIYGAALKMGRVLAVGWSCTDLAPATENLRTRCKLLGPSTLTAGSGGTTPTPQKVDPGDANASITAHANDTSQASTTGTNNEEASDSSPLATGYVFTFPKPPILPPTSAFIFDLYAAPGAARHITAWALVEEMG